MFDLHIVLSKLIVNNMIVEVSTNLKFVIWIHRRHIMNFHQFLHFGYKNITIILCVPMNFVVKNVNVMIINNDSI